MSVAPHVASYPDGDHIIERFMPPPRRSGVFHQDRMNVQQMKLKPPHVDHNLQFAIRSYRGELAWRDCRLATQMNRGGCPPLPAYQRFYARASRYEMAPFVPPPPPEGIVPVLVRNSTTIPVRVKIVHDYLPDTHPFIQVVLGGLSSQTVRVPGMTGHGIDPATGLDFTVTMTFQVTFEQSGAVSTRLSSTPQEHVDCTVTSEGKFSWSEGDPEGMVAVVSRVEGAHQIPCFKFFATMSEAISEMQAPLLKEASDQYAEKIKAFAKKA